MQTLQLDLKDRAYPIYIGVNLLQQSELFSKLILGHQVLIVTNDTIAPLYLERVQEACQSKQCDVVILPDGEQYKTLTTLNQVFDSLLTRQHTRTTTLIALGGGVICDLTGFAAATYMRGVNYIQLPTTLLAQVDAAVGGKTGVNHPLGKNMIGAFYQPRAVIADTNTLSSLPQRVFCEGIAEVIKYGLIQDAAFFSWLEQNMGKLLQRDPETLEIVITRSCEIKAALVMADERESGVRALLNLGHTFGHAIENSLGYGSWLHGEAVAVGMSLAAKVSEHLGWIKKDITLRIKQLLQQVGLPIALPAELTIDQLLTRMAVDKKNIHGRLRLVLLKDIGQAIITDEVSSEILRNILDEK